MPGLVRNHDRAARLNNSPFMKEIRAKIEKAGVSCWPMPGSPARVASKKGCIRKPDDIKGLKIRSAGPTFAGHVAGGRRLDRVDPVERSL